MLNTEDIIPLLKPFDYSQPKHRRKRIKINGLKVNVYSHRLDCFRVHGIICRYCELEAIGFRLKKNFGDKFFHLVLIGPNGEIFTHDHVIARRHGGIDHIDNFITSCMECNQKREL